MTVWILVCSYLGQMDLGWVSSVERLAVHRLKDRQGAKHNLGHCNRDDEYREAYHFQQIKSNFQQIKSEQNEQPSRVKLCT